MEALEKGIKDGETGILKGETDLSRLIEALPTPSVFHATTNEKMSY